MRTIFSLLPNGTLGDLLRHFIIGQMFIFTTHCFISEVISLVLIWKSELELTMVGTGYFLKEIFLLKEIL